jgi:hypothetical protein
MLSRNYFVDSVEPGPTVESDRPTFIRGAAEAMGVEQAGEGA